MATTPSPKSKSAQTGAARDADGSGTSSTGCAFPGAAHAEFSNLATRLGYECCVMSSPFQRIRPEVSRWRAEGWSVYGEPTVAMGAAIGGALSGKRTCVVTTQTNAHALAEFGASVAVAGQLRLLWVANLVGRSAGSRRAVGQHLEALRAAGFAAEAFEWDSARGSAVGHDFVDLIGRLHEKVIDSQPAALLVHPAEGS